MPSYIFFHIGGTNCYLKTPHTIYVLQDSWDLIFMGDLYKAACIFPRIQENRSVYRL